MITKILKVPIDADLYQKIKDISDKDRRSIGSTVYKLLKLGVSKHSPNEIKSLFTSKIVNNNTN
jgi:hypothetical protein